MNYSSLKTKHTFLAYVLFLFSPLTALLVALRNYSLSWSKNVVWAFAAFLGYSLQVGSEYTGDALSYKNKFLYFHFNNIGYEYFKEVAFSNSNHIEFLQTFLSISVSKFTSDYHFLFLVFGIFYGFFFSRNISYLYSKGNNKNKFRLFLTYGLFFTMPLWNINGFDFWTAAQVFIYATLPFIYEKRINRLGFLLLCPFIHFSFYLGWLLILLIPVAFKIKRLLPYLFLGSFFFIGALNDLIADAVTWILPDIIYSRTSMYLNSIGKQNQGGAIIGLIGNIYHIALSIFFYLSYQRNRSLLENRNEPLFRLYLFAFYLAIVFNILSSIPSVGRFLFVAQYFMIACVFLLVSISIYASINAINSIWSLMKLLFIGVWILNIVRYLFPVLGIGSVLSNPFLLFLFKDDDFVFGNFLDFLAN